MTEVRRLNAGDVPSQSRIYSLAFNMRKDFAKEEKEKAGKPDPLADPPEWSWGAFQNGKLVSVIIEFDYLMRFDRQSVPLSGIGGVATLPEYRKGGLVRQIFDKFFAEAYEKGVLFSNLVPFSHNYYRQFGYETACARKIISIPLREFSHLKLKGEFIQIYPGDDTSKLNEVHNSYIDNLNHAIARDYWPDNRAWKVFTKEDPYSTGVHVFLWMDDKGVPKGYVRYDTPRSNNENSKVISVQHLAFVDRDALYGVLSLCGVLGAQFDKFQWVMPTFLDAADFVKDPFNIEQKIIPRDMTRVIHVKKALEKMRRPAGEGEYVIEVEDSTIKANKGRYLIEYGKEGSRVTVSEKEPDMHCDVTVLSQLITGYRSLENALYSRNSGLEVHKNVEHLKQVFTERPQHLTEYF